ncbi:hypothetical protein P154DRAFT_567522 [Amniculicola lignicola CBS 123094]|uniref:Uncharacterized protein n=1 Tax=Amniculicola lignicola CBS 123094 TaxID=1392246 RepID=A0A6A5VXN2_9PLEO|nr:hypothetical protein P154DRAFT_567522 [Amniculicola lignicola CBS 123094]
MTDFEPTTEAEFEAFMSSQWQLGRKLSNPRLIDGVFVVDEKTPEGLITYSLPLNDFLAVKEKHAVPGTGFYENKTTRNVQLDEKSQYTLKFEASSNEGDDDWSEGTKGSKSYEMPAEDVKAFVVSGEEEGQIEEGEEAPGEAHESHPEHQALEPAETEPELVANGIFGAGAKLGKLVNFFIDGPEHPGKIKTRTDAKGHSYFGCEKHEHPVPGDMRVSNPIFLRKIPVLVNLQAVFASRHI